MTPHETMNTFGKRLDGPGGRRKSQREPVRLAAAMHTVGASRTVSVIDVSRTGARLTSQLNLAVGQEIWLKIFPADVFARVRWAEEGTCGVLFDEPLSDAEVARLRARGRIVILPHLSVDEQLGIEEWEAGLAR